jgi:molybdate transport repressor ModE-like protein
MIEVDLRTVWRVRANGTEHELDQLLIAVLGGIVDTGKLTAAAKHAGISHRHARNIVNRWGAFLGAPLVVMQRGRGTRLTPVGDRLLWAGRRVQLRLTPELESLAGDFARDINQALGGRDHDFMIHASHDFAVALLRERLAERRIPVELQSRGSFDALASLMRNECIVAGFHIADGALGMLMARRYAEAFAGHDVRLLPLARRQQGFITARGNPKQIRNVSDLARPDVTLVNRQRGSGTRALFEYLLSEAGIDRRTLKGYNTEETTHSAVAALIAGLQADVGFGIEAAAARFRLDFIPVATERYFLAIDAANLGRSDVQAMLAIVTDAEFASAVNAIPGYHALAAATPLLPADAIGACEVPVAPG